ncbi:pyridoxamine 5'-phosphate oxidase family protein [Prauserella cavernicola]|uniref:Pyridoxamine 5'-phosphate oxidase family protein n=1 Tax=Prauserella cavernicola TaxID=2800127 RepID=A0A934QZ55_9PSEU|nr:pyridoxamine 5'-phosphate oxidase family protein [Prauserella cavernicola]MBK1788777.1 pyridoxamine 5'-phosphate oxidase family protein [Prauserella cavernicola]
MNDAAPRRIEKLTSIAALRLLGTVSFGRVAFTLHALPAIRPAGHTLDGGDVIIRGHSGSDLDSAAGQIVAYEADVISPEDHLGWSVSVTGKAELVLGVDAITRCESLFQRPETGPRQSVLLRLPPEFVTGYTVRDGAA